MKSSSTLLQFAALLWVIFSIAVAFQPWGHPWGRPGVQPGVKSMPRSDDDDLPSGPSIPIQYCSNINTADMEPFNSIYQSEGRCYRNCTDLKYALAIVQDLNCWCSNLIPNSDDRTSVSECSSPCPGYPPDHCGGDQLFGYIAAGGGNPKGTAPAGGSATALPVSSISSSSKSSSIPNTTQPPVVETVTIGGTVRTVTATLDPTPSSASIQPNPEKDSGITGGVIAGIIVGVLAAVGAAAVAFFCWRRKRRHDWNEKSMTSPAGRGGSPAMMTVTTTGEGSAAGGSAGLDSNKRRSYLMPIDPRLDPFAKGIYVGDPNRSRESFNSLQDNQDYSRRVHDPPRVLRAINPDPDNDD